MAGIALGAKAEYSRLFWLPVVGSIGLASLFRKRFAARVFALAVVLFFGIAWCSMRSSVPEGFPGEGDWRVRARVRTEIVLRGDGAARFDVSNLSFFIDTMWLPVSGGAYVWIEDESAFALEPGDWIELNARVLLPQEQRNPGGFNARAWSLARGDFCTILCDRPITLLRSSGFSVARATARLRGSIGRRMDALFGSESPIARAMVLGDRETLPSEWRDAFARTGIVHLLAVSGLHVGFIYMMLRLLIDIFHPSPRARFLWLTILISGYALLTGMSPSILRASVMLLFLSYARVVSRKTDPATSLSVAASAILLFRPTDLQSMGFQLSFGCVFGIVMLASPLRRFLRRALPGKFTKVADGLTLSISAQIGALVPSAAMLGWISITSLLANLIAVPIATLVFPLVIPTLLLDMFAHPAAVVIAWLPRLAIKSLLWIAQMGSRLGLIVRVPAMVPPLLGLGVYVCMFLCSDAVRISARSRAATAILILASGALSGVPAIMRTDYVQLDVGQALSGVLRADGETVIFDTGKDGQELVDYLTYVGANADAVFISHGHSDHYGGLAALIDSMIPVRTIYISSGVGGDIDPMYNEILAAARAKGVPVIPLSRGDKVLTPGGLAFDILWPPYGYESADANETSLVARVEVNGHAILWTGDVGVMEPLRGSNCDILQAGHHGSKTSTSETFLRYTTPNLALISCAKGSPYLPHPETLARLNDAGVATLRTDVCGAVTVYLDRDELRASPFIAP
jgi:competence protein ComEC